ncbi:MAG: hypothetical protein ACRDNK_19945 [Solirubrobacteraceae bacterium]
MTPLLEVDRYAGDPLAQRLQRLDIRLPTELLSIGELDGGGRRRPAARRQRLRLGGRVAMAAGVAVAGSTVAVSVFHVGSASTATLHVPGFTVEVAASARTAARMNREQATAVAVAWLSRHPFAAGDTTRFTGFAVTGATYESGVLKVWENCGAHWFLPEPSNLWVIDLTAPPQLGSTYVRGSVLVDDDTGQAQYADLLTSRTTPSGC